MIKNWLKRLYHKFIVVNEVTLVKDIPYKNQKLSCWCIKTRKMHFIPQEIYVYYVDDWFIYELKEYDKTINNSHLKEIKVMFDREGWES